jgi:hypothetical protein
MPIENKPHRASSSALAHLDGLLDEALEQTFPASDAVAIDFERESYDREAHHESERCADHSIEWNSLYQKQRGEAAATAGQWVDNARSRRAVSPTPCARPDARSG